MAKRTTDTGGEGAPARAPARKSGTGARKTTKRAAPKRAAAEDEPKRTTKRATAKRAEPKRERAPRRPSRVKALGSSIGSLANRLLAQADEEAVKNILTAGALAAAAVMLGEAAVEAVEDRDGTRADTPPSQTKLKAAAAAGGAAMGAQLLKTLEEARERKGLADAGAFDPKALAAKAMTALITQGDNK